MKPEHSAPKTDAVIELRLIGPENFDGMADIWLRALAAGRLETSASDIQSSSVMEAKGNCGQGGYNVGTYSR
jgi:hypothetical protein